MNTKTQLREGVKLILSEKLFSFLPRLCCTSIPPLQLSKWLSLACYLLWKLQIISISFLFTLAYIEDPTFGPIVVLNLFAKSFLIGELLDY